MAGPRQTQVADRGVLHYLTEKTCPARVVLHTSWPPAKLGPFSFAAMPGTDDAILWGTLAIDSRYRHVLQVGRECMPSHYNLGEEAARFKDCCRVSVNIETLQHRELQAESDDEAVEQLITNGLDIFMTP